MALSPGGVSVKVVPDNVDVVPNACRFTEISVLVSMGWSWEMATTVEAHAFKRAQRENDEAQCWGIYMACLTEAETILEEHDDWTPAQVGAAMTAPPLGERAASVTTVRDATEDDEVCWKCGAPAFTYEHTRRGDEPTIGRFVCPNKKCH